LGSGNIFKNSLINQEVESTLRAISEKSEVDCGSFLRKDDGEGCEGISDVRGGGEGYDPVNLSPSPSPIGRRMETMSSHDKKELSFIRADDRAPRKSVEKVAVKIERQVGNEQLKVGELVEGCGRRKRRGSSVDRDEGGRKRLIDFDPRFNVQEQLPNNHILNSIAHNSNEKSYQTMSGYLEPNETQTPSAHTHKVVSTSEKVVPGLSMGTDPDFKNIFSKHSPKNPSLNAHNPISFNH
jgi:hypothetical protein